MNDDRIKHLNIAGNTRSTTTVLITAPRASSVQIAPIISTFEYRATPNVAAKKLHPLTIIDFIENLCAMEIDSFLVFPKMTLFLIVTCHQDRIVYGCTQLDGTDYDTCNKWKRYPLVIRDCHINKNCKFDNKQQNKW